MKLKLKKELVIQLYCYTLQGERSIAFGLGTPWSELRAYYLGEKMDALQRFTQHFAECLARQGVPFLALPRNEMGPYFPSVSLLQYFLGKWIANRKSQWTFPGPAGGFMAYALRSLVQALDSEIRPDQERLISLRIDLCTSRTMIENRCYGLRELLRARRIEHFWHADWIPSLRFEEVLGKPPIRDGSPTKKSA
jgi:hypothetical protein